MAGGRLLLLDEPSLGLAPVVIDHIYEAIATLKAKGVTIVIVEENASKVVDLVNKIYLLDDGQFVWEGTPDQLEMQREVVETYLGG
jgi:branched-chain amino acid transport system ATP-binding protein